MTAPPTSPAASALRCCAERVTALADSPIPAAIRAGVVAVVPLTIVGGLFMLLAHPPLPALERAIAPWAPLLEIPVTATFGVLALFVTLAVAHDLGRRRGQDRLSSVVLAGVSFLLVSLDPASASLRMEALGSAGILTAILVAVIAVEVQALMARKGVVIRMPGEVPEIRERLRAEIAAVGPAVLHHRLAGVDREAARRIHQNDAKRIIRALEVAASGVPLSAAFAPAPHPVFGRQMMVVDLPRALLRDRIDQRVERMFAAGLVDETRRAEEGPGGIGPTASQAAGYSEALGVLAGTLSLSEAIRLTQARTRQLAKRQLTWLRSFSGAVWIAA